MFRLPLVDKESNKENIYNAFYKYDGSKLESLVLNEDMIVHYAIY